MHYDAYVTREDGTYLIEFPDCVGCQTQTDNDDEVLAFAREALEGWLEANLVERRIPPHPKRHRSPPRGGRVEPIFVGPKLSIALQVRWARQELSLSQKDLAERVGVTQQAIAKIEDPDANPTLDTLSKVATALGLTVEVTMKKTDSYRELAAVRPPRVRAARRVARSAR